MPAPGNGPQFHASSTISGFGCSPEDITRLLGLVPTRALLKGEVATADGSIRSPANIWTIDAPDTTEDSAEAQLEALASLIEPHVASFTTLPLGTTVTVGIDALDGSRLSPSYVPSRCLDVFAAIGAGLQF